MTINDKLEMKNCNTILSKKEAQVSALPSGKLLEKQIKRIEDQGKNKFKV